MTDFYHRAQPLADVSALLEESRAAFAKKWAAGEEYRAIGRREAEGNAEGDGSEVRVGAWKRGTMGRGTVRQRAERLYTIMHSDSTAIPVSLLKGKRNGKGKGKTGSLEELSPIAEREFVIGELCVELRDVVDNTQAFNEKKIIQSYAERVKDEEGKEVSEEEQKEEEEDEDEDEKPIYNPLNLPLGWDGKPIPYWLYKQYGLDKEYKCEICGNQSYWGRRAFDMHFQEWRHHNGMRCLGIPNTKHFHDITKIEDAKNRRNDGCVTCSVCKD